MNKPESVLVYNSIKYVDYLQSTGKSVNCEDESIKPFLKTSYEVYLGTVSNTSDMMEQITKLLKEKNIAFPAFVQILCGMYSWKGFIVFDKDPLGNAQYNEVDVDFIQNNTDKSFSFLNQFDRYSNHKFRVSFNGKHSFTIRSPKQNKELIKEEIVKRIKVVYPISVVLEDAQNKEQFKFRINEDKSWIANV